MEYNSGISMVIATKGRVKLLENLVETIDIARKNYAGPSELIIVDDSNETESAMVKDMCERHDAQYLYLTPSVCAKRNLGARTAKYPIVLFLDSDCLVTENILNEHEKCYVENEKTGAVCGLLEFTGEGGKFWDAVSKSQFVVCFNMAKWGKTVPWGTTANFSIRKDVFDGIDGFDENFPNKPGGEDVDFGLRIVKSGYEIAACPEALVYHDKATWTPVKAMFKRVWYYGSADTYVMDKHPDHLLGMLPRRTEVFLCSVILSILLSFVISPFCLFGILLWPITDILGTAIMMNCFSPFVKPKFYEQLIIQALVLTNEAGFVYRCITRRKFGYISKQLAYFENQVKGISYNSSIFALCLMVNLLFYLGFMLTMLNVFC